MFGIGGSLIGDLIPGDADPTPEIGASLANLSWQLPFISHAPSATGAMNTIPTTTQSTIMGGTTGVPYGVRLRFIGAIEQKTYTGGSNPESMFYIGGTPAVDNSNLYRLKITYPGDADQLYYLNAGVSGAPRAWPLDVTRDFVIKGGSTVELFADSIDNLQAYNTTGAPVNPPSVTAVPLIMGDVTEVSQPYNGQFIVMKVVTIATPGRLLTEASDLLTTEAGDPLAKQ